tara:strand:- start:5188 stop:6207 length:1020 start_codon:yes stop_codon:yes gene_type:complete
MAKKALDKYARVTGNGMKYLNTWDENVMTNNPKIPESIQPYVTHFVKNVRKQWDELTDMEPHFDKSSDEHIAVQAKQEKLGKSYITLDKQIQAYKEGTGIFKKALGGMNSATQEASLFVNSAIYGNQWDSMHINDNGKMSFLVSGEELSQEAVGDLAGNDVKGYFAQTGQNPLGSEGVFNLDDMGDFENGSMPIIQDPARPKLYVLQLAEKIQNDKYSGKPFDEQYIYNNTLTKLTETGANGIIGTAFTDLAGDSQTKSFAEMYEEGLKEEYYINPETGEFLPEGTTWMKDPNNSKVLSQVLSKYITNVMKDIHSPVKEALSEEAQNKLAEELIRKYSK